VWPGEAHAHFCRREPGTAAAALHVAAAVPLVVSVIIPLHNGAEFVAQAVASVLAQELPPHVALEVCIGVNGFPVGSNTWRVALACAAMDPVRVHCWHFSFPLGVPLERMANTCNRMVQRCNGDAICYLDADDWWTSTAKVSAQVEVWESGQADVVGTLASYHATDRDGKPTLMHGVVPKVPQGCIGPHVDFTVCNPMLLCTTMLARADAVFDDAGGILSYFPDYAMWLRLRRAGKRFYNVPSVMAAHRLHAGSAYNTRGDQALRAAELVALHCAVQTTPRVVIVELMGGTGKWLFQAAHGFAFARTHCATLVLENSLAVHCVSPDGLLKNFAFRHKGAAAPHHQVVLTETPDTTRQGFGQLRHGWPCEAAAVRLFGYYQVVPALSTHLDCFISTLHFTAEERADAAIAVPTPDTTAFVHVRRGDYLLPVNAALLHSVSKAYYEACVARLPVCCQIVMFSDGADWVRCQTWEFGCREVRVVALNARATLAAMARCRFAVLANSSFGVWGALLARHAHSVFVQYPEHWTTDGQKPALPADWVQADNATGALRSQP
jgi:hypothetical protein